LVLLALLAAAQEQRLAPISPEERKAMMVLLFAGYTEWPTNAFTEPDAFVLGVLGQDPCVAVLRDWPELIQSGKWGVRDPARPIHGRKLVVRELTDHRGAEQCQLLFITAAKTGLLPQVQAHLQNASVLVVVEQWPRVEPGGIIHLDLQKSRDAETRRETVLSRWDASTNAAARAHLTLSSQILRLAKRVY
jgi:hypothetical protein